MHHPSAHLFIYNLPPHILQVTQSFIQPIKNTRVKSHSQKRLGIHLANISVSLAARSQWSGFSHRSGRPHLTVSVEYPVDNHINALTSTACLRPELSQIALE